jgi:hypothetical protein
LASDTAFLIKRHRDHATKLPHFSALILDEGVDRNHLGVSNEALPMRTLLDETKLWIRVFLAAAFQP